MKNWKDYKFIGGPCHNTILGLDRNNPPDLYETAYEGDLYLYKKDGDVYKYKERDPINHPKHYTHGNIECIQITEQFNFNLGNAIKYIWRCDYKGESIKDLKKANWYIEREIKRRENETISR